MKLIFRLFLALCFGLMAFSSSAEVEPDEKTLQYLKSEPHKKLITMMGMIYDQKIFERKNVCDTGYKWEPISFSILQPLTFQSASEHPDAGVWTYRFRFQRCGETIVYNVIFQGQGGKQPRPGNLPPGLTRSDVRLATDLMKGIGMAGGLAGVRRDCKTVDILDTKITKELLRQEIDGKVREGVWEEQWVARACGTNFTADFCLTPQAAGGTDWILGKCQGKMLNIEQLKSLLSKTQVGAKAEINYSTVKIQKKDNIPEYLIFTGKYEILKYLPDQKYSFNITLIVDGKLIEIYKKYLDKNKDDIVVEVKLSNYVKSQLAEVNSIKVRSNVFFIEKENEGSATVQNLGQLISEEITLSN